MNLRVLLISTSIIAMTASCSSSKKLAQQPPAEEAISDTYVKEISVDGNDADWQGIPLNASPEKSFEYSVAHNNEDLFLRMKIMNPVEQMKFLTAGMTLWIDPTGQKKQKAEIIYPVKGELAADVLQGQNNSGDRKQNAEMMHLNVRAQLVSMDRIGFKPEFSGTQTVSQNTGFKAALNWNSADELIYELKIPLQAFAGNVSPNNLALEFSIGALERPAPSTAGGENSGGGGGYRHGGGMGGGRSGGYHGGGRSGGQRTGEGRTANNSDTKVDWQKMREKESFWVECK